MSRFKKIKGIIIFDDEDLEGLTETDVVFNKEGWYLDRATKKSWYEIQTDNGSIRAFKSSTSDFNHSLRLELHNPLREDEVKAIQTILKTSPKNQSFNLDRSLRQWLYLDCHWKELRSIRRDWGLFFLKHR